MRLLPGGTDVWVVDLVSGGRGTRLTFDPATMELFPTWTPDGTRVAFGFEPPLSWKAADGTGAVEPLVESDGKRRVPHAFFRDGTMLLFEEYHRGLGVVSLEGDRIPTLLWESPYDERNGDLSPDGRWIAYESDESGAREIWVRPFPNVNESRWQVSSGGGAWPLWNPDGWRELFYVGPQGLMTVAVKTEPTFSYETAALLFDTAPYANPNTLANNRMMDISDDGMRFLMLKEGRRPDVPDPVLVQNWTDELQRLVPIP